MNPQNYITDEKLMSDHIYHLPRSKRRQLTAYPATVVTEQKAWHDCREAKVRYQLSEMTCSEIRYIEGVHVQRTHAQKRRSYTIAKCQTVGFEQAVRDVLSLAYPDGEAT